MLGAAGSPVGTFREGAPVGSSPTASTSPTQTGPEGLERGYAVRQAVRTLD